MDIRVLDPVPTPIPAGAIDPDLDLEAEILRLKAERNAVILAHFYQDPAIQEIADFVGDSLDLSRKAAATKADVIAFCGVRFMAEVAKILSPEKTVVLPDINAGCSLEDSCPPDEFAEFRAKHADHISLTYVNCSAAVKVHSDIIVTSSNAEAIISQIPRDQPILFAPDRHLGAYLARKTGRDMLLWQGTCIVHERFSERELIKLKAQYPDAPVAAHPECPAQILDHADHVGSTSSILAFVKDDPAETMIIATEPHIMHEMQKASPRTPYPTILFAGPDTLKLPWGFTFSTIRPRYPGPSGYPNREALVPEPVCLDTQGHRAGGSRVCPSHRRIGPLEAA